MNQRREPWRLEAAAGRAPKGAEMTSSADRASRAPQGDGAAVDGLLQSLARQLVAVEDWCSRHSEYFLG